MSFILKIDFDILRWTHTKSISVHSFARDLMNCLWRSKSKFYKKLLRISKKSKLYETTDSHAMYYYSLNKTLWYFSRSGKMKFKIWGIWVCFIWYQYSQTLSSSVLEKIKNKKSLFLFGHQKISDVYLFSCKSTIRVLINLHNRVFPDFER